MTPDPIITRRLKDLLEKVGYLRDNLDDFDRFAAAVRRHLRRR